jgi:biotin carboxyl carrier protein
MENVLSAPLDCIIYSIEVKKKETVEKNTLLIKFE